MTTALELRPTVVTIGSGRRDRPGGHDVRVLGPVDVRSAGTPVAVPGVKARAVLTVLGLHPGRIVPAGVLTQILWGDAPPRMAAKALLTHVSTLRRCLGEGAVLTHGSGWTLGAPTTDAALFERAAADGREAARAGDALRALRSFDNALAAWRGGPELPATTGANVLMTRWREEHSGVCEDRVDALLACGQHAELVGMLESAVAEAPLREHRWAQLMLALYRAGRQADALDAYRRIRHLLDEQLGVRPGPELRGLQAAILAQHPSLRPAPSMASNPMLRPQLTAIAERSRHLDTT